MARCCCKLPPAPARANIITTAWKSGGSYKIKTSGSRWLTEVRSHPLPLTCASFCPWSSRSSRWYYREIILNRIALRSYVDRRTTRILLNWERMMQCMHNLRSQGLRESGCTRNETRSDQVDLVVGNGGLAVPASFLFAWILFCKARPRYRRGRLSLSIPPLTDPRGIQVGLGQCGSDTWWSERVGWKSEPLYALWWFALCTGRDLIQLGHKYDTILPSLPRAAYGYALRWFGYSLHFYFKNYNMVWLRYGCRRYFGVLSLNRPFGKWSGSSITSCYNIFFFIVVAAITRLHLGYLDPTIIEGLSKIM